MTEESSKSDNQTKKPNLIREKSFIEPNVKQPFGHRLKLNYLDKIKVKTKEKNLFKKFLFI